MKNLTKKTRKGQGLVEYVLIIVLIAVALIGAFGAMKTQISFAFSTIASALSGSV